MKDAVVVKPKALGEMIAEGDRACSQGRYMGVVNVDAFVADIIQRRQVRAAARKASQ